MADSDRDLQSLKDDIRARSDIVEVIGAYTRLKKSGKNWTGLCPFHNDKNPSFSVVPSLQIYKCFSCGEGGDVFKFIQKKENLDFMEALEFLARRAGIPFERKGFSPEKASERDEMFALNEIAAGYFQDRLSKNADAQAYLAQRGILKATQEQFQIGHAPDDWEALAHELQRRRANLELAAKAGLVRSRALEGRGYSDFFRNRLMFPIHDMNGRIVAFGGRAMGDDKPKYLNTGESPLFAKSRTLYGLHFARKKLSGETPAVFVEGYVDVITTHQAGFTQCVATLGTSMTEEHARMLARYNPRVIICYDGDEAGVRATLRGATVWEGIGVEGAEVRVARMPAGDDPDSLLLRGETAAFQAALDNAVPRVDFQIELALKLHNLRTETGRDAALAEIIPILASMPSRSMRGRYAQKFAYLHPLHYRHGGERAIEQMLADAEALARQMKARPAPRDQGYPLTEEANRGTLAEQPPPALYRPPGPDAWPHTERVIRKGGREEDYRRSGNARRRRDGPQSDPSPPPLAPLALSGPEKAERQLLRALLAPEWRVYLLGRLRSETLITPSGRAFYERVARTPADAEGGIDLLQLMRQIDAEESQSESSPPQFLSPSAEAESAPNDKPVKLSIFIQELMEDSAFLASNELVNEAIIRDCLRRLQMFHETQAQRALGEWLQRAETAPPEEKRAAMEQYQQKMREIRGSAPASENG